MFQLNDQEKTLCTSPSVSRYPHTVESRGWFDHLLPAAYDPPVQGLRQAGIVFVECFQFNELFG